MERPATELTHLLRTATGKPWILATIWIDSKPLLSHSTGSRYQWMLERIANPTSDEFGLAARPV